MPNRRSPAAWYEPELLMLAPEAGEDANTLSLVAQLLELGVAVELDENWHLPTTPPKDLGAYKACLFPETARERYDADLDAFYRNGGVLPYYKYYPVQTEPGMSGVHYFIETFGRDAYFYHAANVMLEGDLRTPYPDFARALEARPNESILADLRAQFFAKYGTLAGGWTDWKDPDCVYLYQNLFIADTTGDAEWLALVKRCMQQIVASKASLLGGGIQSQIEGVVETYVMMFGGLLMHAGERFVDDAMTQTGVELGMKWFDYYHAHGGILAAFEKRVWSEFYYRLPPLYWLARITGDSRVAQYADENMEQIAAATQREDGLWAHFAKPDGTGRGLAWSRGTSWPVHGMTLALYALEPQSRSAERIREMLNATYAALARTQDAASGLWRLVIDEPDTRIESSACAAFVHFHDRLKKLGAMDATHDDMIERAAAGLKRICYRHGVAACCRGTSLGVPQYYRTRPLGYSPSSTDFGATVAARIQTP